LPGADAVIDAVIDGAPVRPSCASPSKICGPSADMDCCAAEMVPGDTFFRGHDVAADDAFPDKGCPAMLSSFELDTYEVTVGRFRAFVDAGQGTRAHPPSAGAGAHPKLPDSGWDTSWKPNLTADAAALTAALKCNESSPSSQMWTDAPGVNENKPMSCVSWYEAMAFCIWDGGHLPTEAEWNFAASGGAEQRAYPWSRPASSTRLDCTHTNFGDCGKVHNRVGRQSPTGDGRWGHSDLVGNVWEWTLDWYDSQCQIPCRDCANLAPSIKRVIRGGSLYNEEQVDLRAASRSGYLPPDERRPQVGFRCARTP
jgi:formylglycine-generating enzyme required for sulfatase activity